MLHHADHKPADEVDRGDDKPCDRIAAHELGRAVHGAIKLGLARDLLAPTARLLLINESGVEIGVNGHLFARHGVQGEARGDFGHARRALGDHDEVDDDEDQKHDETHDDIAADDKLSEAFNHMAGRGRAFLAVQKDETGGGDIERKPEQGREKQ